MKLAGLLVLVMPMLVLIFTGIAVSIHAGRAGPENGGPHGFTEILYAFTSPVNNNGSAFAGLDGNTAFYNVHAVGGLLVRALRRDDPGPGARRCARAEERRAGLAPGPSGPTPRCSSGCSSA